MHYGEGDGGADAGAKSVVGGGAPVQAPALLAASGIEGALQSVADADVRIARLGCAAMVLLPLDGLQNLASLPGVDVAGTFPRAFSLHGRDMKVASDALVVLSRLAELNKPLHAVAASAFSTLKEWVWALSRSKHARSDGSEVAAVEVITNILHRNCDSIKLVPLCCDVLAHVCATGHSLSPEELRAAAVVVTVAVKSNAQRLGVSKSSVPALLRLMSSDPSVSKAVGKCGAAGALATILLAHGKHADMCAQALDALTLLRSVHLQGRVSKVLCRGAAEALRTHESNALICEYAALLLEILAISRENDQAIQDARAVSALASAMHRHAAGIHDSGYSSDSSDFSDSSDSSGSCNLRQKAAREATASSRDALLAIARAERDSASLHKGGVGAALVARMAAHAPGDVDAVRLSCRMLCKLARGGCEIPTEAAAGARNCIDLLATAVHEHSREADIVLHSMEVLHRLTGASTRHALVTHGAIGAAAHAIALHGHDADVAFDVCGLLHDLSVLPCFFVPLLAASSALESLITAASWHSSSASIGSSACKAIRLICRVAVGPAPPLEQLKRAMDAVLAVARASDDRSGDPFDAACEALAAVAQMICHSMLSARRAVAAGSSFVKAPLLLSATATGTSSASSSSVAAGTGAGAVAASTVPHLAQAAEHIAYIVRKCAKDSRAFGYAAEAIHYLITALSDSDNAAETAAADQARRAWCKLSSARSTHAKRANVFIAANLGKADDLSAALAAYENPEIPLSVSSRLAAGVRSGSMAIIESMLELPGCSRHSEESVDLQTASLASAAAGGVAMVQALLMRYREKSHLSKPREDDMGPSTVTGCALWVAAATGQLEVVRRMLTWMPPGAGNSLETANAALRMAAAHGHLVVVQLLLQEAGADPAHGCNIAIRLAKRGGHAAVAEVLSAAAAADAAEFAKAAAAGSATA